jgi:transposase
MAHPRTIPPLILSTEDRAALDRLARSRTAPARAVARARVLTAYANGASCPTIARTLGIPLPTVMRCVKKALALGPRRALEDLPRAGRPPRITPEARAWIISLACQKPKDLGWAPEFWSEALLARYVREHAVAAGHPSAGQVQQGTISKLLAAQDLPPHRIQYYLQRKDPDFDRKMVPVLHVYQPVTLDLDPADGRPTVRWSYDEPPGIQALAPATPDRWPCPDGAGPGTWARDDEYRRLGTLSLLAGIDLATGEVLGIVRSRHRSAEFVAWLQALDARYGPDTKIQVVLDNHAAHTSRETRAYLATRPNRFEFVFTPVHASWLNLMEMFLAKLAKQCLGGIRVASLAELPARLEQYLAWLNTDPGPFRWRWRPESTEAPTPLSKTEAI